MHAGTVEAESRCWQLAQLRMCVCCFIIMIIRIFSEPHHSHNDDTCMHKTILVLVTRKLPAHFQSDVSSGAIFEHFKLSKQ
jgi:hypothetical protein